MDANSDSLDELRRNFARDIAPPHAAAAASGDIEAYLSGIVSDALGEDIGPGDATTRLLVPPDKKGTGKLVARCTGVLAGMPLAELVFKTLDESIVLSPALGEGETFSTGDSLATVSGRLASILTAERVALNFLQRLTGIATAARRFVDAVDGTAAEILDTRKTTPNFRLLEKYAVRMGGGKNHRFGLHDAVFIKDNHITAAVRAGAENRVEAIALLTEKARKESKLPLIVEVENADEAVASAPADVVLLDNMPPDIMREVVERFSRLEKHGLLEASGGVTLENVREIAETGVDRISVGSLTHSAKAADISLEIS